MTTTLEIIEQTMLRCSGRLDRLDEAYFTRGMARSPAYILGFIQDEIERGDLVDIPR